MQGDIPDKKEREVAANRLQKQIDQLLDAGVQEEARVQEKKDDRKTSDLIVRTKVRNFNLVLSPFITFVSQARSRSINSRIGDLALMQNRMGGWRVTPHYWEPLFAQALSIQGRSARIGIFRTRSSP